MSILIKGMDKPTDCGLCPFEDFGYCNVKGERNTSEEGIDADCPLIEVADRKTEPQTDDFFREPTAEERKAVAEYIESISIPTGVNVFDLMDEATISKMEQVDEPQNEYPCEFCRNSNSQKCEECKDFGSNYEPQTERSE